MTQSGMPTRIAMPCPFAGADGAALGTIGLTSGDSINFPQGFPSVYGSPASEGGKYVKRAELNAIGNMATNDLFYHKCGGLNTFDKKFCDAIGGYPQGAVLDYIYGNAVRKIMSLKDNNTYNVITNGIDGESWIFCDDTVFEKKTTTLFSSDVQLYGTGTILYGNIYSTVTPYKCFITEDIILKGNTIIPPASIGTTIEYLIIYISYRKPNETTNTNYLLMNTNDVPSDILSTFKTKPISFEAGTYYQLRYNLKSGNPLFDIKLIMTPL